MQPKYIAGRGPTSRSGVIRKIIWPDLAALVPFHRDQTGYVYAIVNGVTGERYVGKSKSRVSARWAGHIRALSNNTHANPWLQNAFDLYGMAALDWVLLERTTYADLLARETYWLNWYRELGVRLYNSAAPCDTSRQIA